MFLCLNLSFAFVELFYGIWESVYDLINVAEHLKLGLE